MLLDWAGRFVTDTWALRVVGWVAVVVFVAAHLLIGRHLNMLLTRTGEFWAERKMPSRLQR